MTLAQLIYRISTDSAFASAFRAQPRQQLATVGVHLGEDETSALLRVLEERKEQGRALAAPDEWPAWFSDLF
jgi:hypothetical protein